MSAALAQLGPALVLVVVAATVYLAGRPFRHGATWHRDLARLRAWTRPRLAHRSAAVRSRWPRLWTLGHALVVTVRVVTWPLWWLIDTTTVLRGGTPPRSTLDTVDASAPDPVSGRDWDGWAAELYANADGPRSTSGDAEAFGISVGDDGQAVDPAQQYTLDQQRRAEERDWIARDRQAHADLLARQERILALHQQQQQAVQPGQPIPQAMPVMAPQQIVFRRRLGIRGLVRLMAAASLAGLFIVGAIAQVVGPAFLDWVDRNNHPTSTVGGEVTP